MKEATVIYPHQLFANHPAVALGRPIYLIEEPLFFTEFPIHRQKLLLHRLSMRAYYHKLIAAGHEVTYLEINDVSATTTVFAQLKKAGFEAVHVVDVTDFWLTRRISVTCKKFGIMVHRYESPLFILSKAEAEERYGTAKKHMARFYQKLRSDTKILVTHEGEPEGGRWSFDSDNRKRVPKNFVLPADPEFIDNDEVAEALTWLKIVPGDHYGIARQWIPYTHDMAQAWLDAFLNERLAHFGDYEDALSTTKVRLFHSVLSPLLNIGLLTPDDVLAQVLRYAERNPVPINSLEGFVRQILGWREFIRAAYECDGVAMRTTNFWQHTRTLPHGFWTAKTGVEPLDATITTVLEYGYAHHIERLMVQGNFLLLAQVHPDYVYRWFMAMYVDAYDWVMVPNVYGMSQFADGGIFATKPYISGSNYLNKMSDYPKGGWEELWTALYWNFIETHKAFFSKNHRLSMMPMLLNKMEEAKKEAYLKRASKFLA